MLKEFGRLEDCFGDNGIVSAMAGQMVGEECHIQLWVMSCRILKRNMEMAMADTFANHCMRRKVKRIYGYYYPTLKNRMVKELYGTLGFERIKENADGSTEWRLDLESGYKNKNKVIQVEE